MRKLLCSLAFAALMSVQVSATENSTLQTFNISFGTGEVTGQVFALLNNEKAPLSGKVSLTDETGKTISTSKTDLEGKFTFKDVKPGTYTAIGVAGDYVGGAKIVVSKLKSESSKESYTSIPLAVAPAPSSAAIYSSYAALPAASFSSAPSMSLGSYGGCGCSGGGSTYGGGFGGGGFGGGLNFRRLAFLGGAVAIPIALSGGNDDPASPTQ